MIRFDYLNAASDLRRIANWVIRGRTEKIELITQMLNSLEKDPKIKMTLSHFDALKDPGKQFKDPKKRIFFAEQLLVSSSCLQNKYL